MNPSLLLEAAFRSVLLAIAVWTGLRIFNVRNVMAQKAAWGVVLASAVAMPIVLPMAAHWSVLPANVRVTIPADPQNLLEELQAGIQARTSPKPTASAEEIAAPDNLQGKQGGEALASDAPREAGTSLDATSEGGAIEYVPVDPAPIATPQGLPAQQPAQGAAAPARKFSLLIGLLLLYVAVTGVLLLRLLCGLIAAIRLWLRATPVSGDLPMPRAGSLDATSCSNVRSSSDVASPVTICSAIVLPANYSSWDSEKLRVVLAHERSHIRQGDFYLQLLAGIYAACFWPSPLGWWLKRKLSDLAEAISDRAGLVEATDRTSYAQILLEFAVAPRPTPIGVAMARSGSLSRRIERLLNDVSFSQAFAGTRRTIAAVVILPLLLFATTAMVRVEAAGQNTQRDSSQAALPATGVVSPEIAPAPATPEMGQSQAGKVPEPPATPTVPANPVAPASPEVAPAAPSSGVAAAPQIPIGPGAPEIAPLAPRHAPADCPDKLDKVPVPPAHAPAAPAHAPVAPAHVPVVPRVMILPGTPSHSMTLIAPRAISAPRMVVLPRLAVVPNHAMLALIAPGAVFGEGRGYGKGQSASSESGTMSYSNNGKRSGYHYFHSGDGQSYAVIRGNDTQHMTFSGNWMEGRAEEIEKARKQAKGDFLWFTRDGKSYFLDDPATLAQIEAMYKPMEELGRQQEELGKKQEVLGKQQEELGKQQEAVSVPTPDMSKEIAKIDEAMAKLKASQGKNMTQEQFADLQERLGELQGRLGELQGQIGSRQGEFGARMGELGAKMGALGAQQGELGARQGKIAQQADEKVRSIIDESLKNGKAHPVQ